MFYQLLAGGLVSLVNFGLHAIITGIVVVAARHTAAATDDLHVFARVSALLMITMVALMIAHTVEIAVWASFYALNGIETEKASAFEFAFENYTALGYGDAVPGGRFRLIGPITALNGLLLIGWSVAIIFEVMKMADVQVARKDSSS
ncbi:ion channel [Rhodoplanes sp. Z2-YC6860]|uniref:ion channel n=1 Tax=Rhodoplanes sp. Z2-YC6860 TaxID=674703 RepID=UPI00078BFECE|nr:ion channel [Rhodoplanes sp. Z2-YC6860]AMN45201.1 Ion transport 2 domain-containing protein [Rhodoplanes sp. Z2-YC6860]